MVKVYLNTSGNAVIVDDGVSQINVIRVDSFFYEKDETKDYVTIRDTDDDYTKRVPSAEVTDESGTPYGTIDDVVAFFDTIFTASAVVPLPAGASTEAKQDSQISIMTSILNNMIASQDIEILLVRDTGAVPVEIVQQIREYDQGTGVWTTRYEDVSGTAYVPVGPIEYLDASAVLNLILTEALDQGLTLDSIEAEQLAQGLSLDSLVTNTTGLSTEVTLAALLSAFNSEDFSQEATSQLINSNIVLGNLTLNGIKTQTDLLNFIATALEVNVTSSALPTGAATEATQVLNNTALGSILAQLDVDLSTRASQATQELINTTLGFILAQLDVDLSTRASESTVSTLATEAKLEAVRALLATIDADTSNIDVALSSRLNTLGRKAETASAPVVLSDEDFASLEAIRVAVQNLDVDVDGIATEVTLAALLTAFNNEDFASETTLASILACLCTDEVSIQSILSGLRTDFNAEDFATQTTLQALLTAFNAEDFATQTTLASLLTAFNAEDFATETTLQSVLTAIQALASPTGLALEATQLLGNTTLASILTAITGEDFASETTLAALLLAFNGEDFATETTLAAIKAKTDQLLFDVNSALNVVLPAGVVNTRYTRLAGIGSYTVFPGNTKASILNYGSVAVTVDNGLGPVQLDPGIGLDFAAPEGKTLGAITTASTSASALVAITQVGN